MPNNHRSLVLTVLSRHVGTGNGISMRQLEQQLDMLPRMIRTHISDLRDDGHAVCGTPHEGYFIAATAEELQHTCEFLRSRAMHSLTLESRLRKIPLDDLIGQLHLPT
jgi:biotin operon repressor